MVLAVGCAALAAALLWPLRDSERLLLDAHFRHRRPHLVDPQIMLVVVDDASVRALGRPPWEAGVYTRLLEIVMAGNPKSVVWMLPAKGEDAEAAASIDAELSASLQSALFLTTHLDEHPYDPARSATVQLHPALARHALGSGVVSVATERDGVARFAHVRYKAGSDAGPTLATILAQRHGADPAAAPTDADGRYVTGYAGPPGTFPRLPVARLLDGELDPELLRGKVAIVAPAATQLERQVMTPTSAHETMPVAEVFANALNTHLAGRYVWRAPRLLLLLSASLYGVLVGGLFLRIGAGRASGATLVLLVGAPAVSHVLFAYADVWFDTRPTLAATLFGLATTIAVDLRRLTSQLSDAARGLSEGSLGLHQRAERAATDDAFWRELAQSAGMFLNVDGMTFLEREHDTDRLKVAHARPDGGGGPPVDPRYTRTHRHIIHVAQGSPALVQDFASTAGVDTYLVPLMSFGRLVGVWALHKQDARAYFDEREDSISYLAEHITGELARRGAIQRTRAETSPVARVAAALAKRRRGPGLRELVRSVTEERSRIGTVMNSIGDGVVFYDLLGRSLLYNDQALDIAAQLEGEADIRRLHDAMYAVVATANRANNAEENRELAHDIIENVLVRGRNAGFLVEVGDERKRYYQIAVTAVRRAGEGADAAIIGIACVLSDVSIYEQITEYKDVMGAIESRGRNYLTPIRGFAPILLATDLTDQQRQMVDAIQRNADDLAATLDEFRNHTELHTGPTRAHELLDLGEGRVPIDLMEMAREIAAWKLQNGVNVVVVHRDELVERVWGVRSLVEAVIVALVDMLWEHLPADSEVRLSVEWATAKTVSVDVYEEGYGVPQDALDATIRELSEDGDGPVEISLGDLNALTLQQIRHVVTNVHGGEISCESHLGRGMKFSMSLRTIL
ncbi:CHASE2 domain-containing protein [Candidatus Poribacteria bacterium]|nr:CHASE2 domain-containing protein [Candidatus Poribacteria bacterium]